jgi:hypothetical protein
MCYFFERPQRIIWYDNIHFINDISNNIFANFLFLCHLVFYKSCIAVINSKLDFIKIIRANFQLWRTF